jgi:hypothetical protein
MSNFSNIDAVLSARDFTTSVLQVFEASTFVVWYEELKTLLASKNIHLAAAVEWDQAAEESKVAELYEEISRFQMILDIATVAKFHDHEEDPVIKERMGDFLRKEEDQFRHRHAQAN